MGYTNPKQLLVDATKFPAQIEGMLPEAAPKFSEILSDTAGRLPDLPDFPVEVPDLPAPPELPEVGALRLGGAKPVKEVGGVERAVPRRGRTRFLY